MRISPAPQALSAAPPSQPSPARRPPDGRLPKEKDDHDLRGQPQESGRLGQRL